MTATVIMNREGRITLPAEVRRALKLEADSPLGVSVVGGKVVLTPLVVFPRWLLERLTPEALARYLAAARIDPERGLEFEGLGWRDLEALLPPEARITNLDDEDLNAEDEPAGEGA